MRLKCSISLRTILTLIVVCWFMFRVLQRYMRMYRPDTRLEQIGMIHGEPFSQDSTGMYLRKIENRFKMENFELIQMMNQTNPNQISDDAMIVISASHSSVEYSYAHLLEKIEQSNQGNNRLPFYLLRKAKSLLMQNSKQIKLEVDQIVKVLEYFTQSLHIKKLTILSFQQGSLLCLRSLAFIKYDVFSIIDKLILINPFNPTIMIFHGNSATFLEQTKQKILVDPVRLQLTNHTRIIIIHTMIDNNPGDHKINWLFSNNKSEKITFSNSLVVTSKLLWNVYSYLKPQQYFKFEPFNQIITRLFNQDREHGPLTIQEISYLLLYRQLPTKRYMSIGNRNKLLSKCLDYYMENYNRDGIFLNAECIRVLRKQDFYFNLDTAIIVKAQGKFQVYGENYQKISPYDTKGKQTIYLLQNAPEFRRFFIINKKKLSLHLIILPTIKPSLINFIQEPKNSQQIQKLKTFVIANPIPVQICSGTTIIYPHNYLPYLFESFIFESLSENSGDCFGGIDIYLKPLISSYQYWSLGCNLIIFSLFCFHVVKKSTFSRFYYQLILNYTLSYLHTGESLFLDNVAVLSLVVAIQQFLKLVVFMADMIYIPKNLAIKVMWIPLVFQILKRLEINVFFSPWKALGLLSFAGTLRHNIIILFVEVAFILEYVIRDISNAQGLFLCCAWLAFSSMQENQQTKPQIVSNDIIVITTGRRLKSIKMTVLALRKQIVNTVTACIIAMCLSEDGIALHFIIDFYITTYVIFAVHQFFDLT